MPTYQELKDALRPHYPLFIGGDAAEAEGGARMDVLCPSNGEVLCTAAVASRRDVDAAVAAARSAFPAWRALPMPRRYELLMACYEAVIRELPRLSALESLDLGRLFIPSQKLIRSAAQLFPYYASLLRVHEDGTSSDRPGERVMVVREPLGVVGAICAWNGPLTQAFWKIAPALAAGNCVVIKPSSNAPLSTLEMTRLLGDLLPPGVLNAVNGPGSTVGQWLTEHPGIDKLSLTGSGDAGISAALAGARNIIPVTLELGGKSAGIYFDDIPPADLDRAAAEICRHVTNNSGQVCRMQSRVLVQDTIYEDMVERVRQRLERVKVGPPWAEDADMGPLAYPEHMEKVLRYIELGKSEGARLVTGGFRLTEGELAKGCFLAPTVFADVDNSMRIAREEIFGPVICMIPFRDEAEAVRLANDSPYGLGGGIFTGDLSRALRVAAAMEAGDIRINGAPGRSLGGSAFGGYKHSGVGRENYKTTLDAYSQLKTISF